MTELAAFREQKCYRLIPSRFPPIALFEDVADSDDFDALYAVQALTNPRIQESVGNLDLVPSGERVFGIPGAGYIMAAFTHVNPDGNRFSNGDYGIYYAAKELDDAIEETKYHRARFLSYTNEPAQEIDMRCLVAVFSADLGDIRPELGSDLYNPTDYSVSQAFGAQCKAGGLSGIVYRSVRGENDCYAVLKPKVFLSCKQASHFGYVWDGQSITTVYKKVVNFKTP